MLLTFSKKFNWYDKPTEFQHKIQAGTKVHTFRFGDRWTPGKRIDFWSGNPRNVKNNPYPFVIPESSAEYWASFPDSKTGEYIMKPLCSAVERFEMNIESLPTSKTVPWKVEVELKIGDFYIDTVELLDLVAMNDGFDTRNEFLYHFDQVRLQMQKDQGKKINLLTGQVVHWTKHNVYDPDTANLYEIGGLFSD